MNWCQGDVDYDVDLLSVQKLSNLDMFWSFGVNRDSWGYKVEVARPSRFGFGDTF